MKAYDTVDTLLAKWNKLNIKLGHDKNPLPLDSSKRRAKRQAEALAMSLRGTWVDLKEAIWTSQARVSSRENEKCRDPALAPGDISYLDTRHLSRGCPTPKLDYY